MIQFDEHTDDPIQQKIDQLRHISEIGKQLNAKGVWKLTLEFSRFGETATLCLFRTADTSGQAIVQTTVLNRPEQPLTTEQEHEAFQHNLREHLNGLIALIQHLTQATSPPSPDPVTEQNRLIGVNEHD